MSHKSIDRWRTAQHGTLTPAQPNEFTCHTVAIVASLLHPPRATINILLMMMREEEEKKKAEKQVRKVYHTVHEKGIVLSWQQEKQEAQNFCHGNSVSNRRPRGSTCLQEENTLAINSCAILNCKSHGRLARGYSWKTGCNLFLASGAWHDAVQQREPAASRHTSACYYLMGICVSVRTIRNSCMMVITHCEEFSSFFFQHLKT